MSFSMLSLVSTVPRFLHYGLGKPGYWRRMDWNGLELRLEVFHRTRYRPNGTMSSVRSAVGAVSLFTFGHDCPDNQIARWSACTGFDV